MNWNILLESSIYFLALINPASKVLLLSSITPPLSRRLIWEISIKATLAAFGILVLLSTCGHLLLSDLFHVEIYSLRISGGIILFLFGLKAVQQGRFYENASHRSSPAEMSIVPLGAPLIAGPGTITASIAYTSEHGVVTTLLALLVALLVNLVLMLFSIRIGNLLERLHATGPLIRITGLIVSAVAVQMVCAGASEWLRQIQ
ncbi:MAG: MarC family protein [Kiritimatiellia bacterium]|nr:MarC family protein [Kiritimatiellia bacterium]